MTPVVTAIIVGTMTYLGRVARNEKMSIQIVVGIAGLAVSLSVLDMINPELAKQFSVLVVLAVALAHWEVIVKATGLGKYAK